MSLFLTSCSKLPAFLAKHVGSFQQFFIRENPVIPRGLAPFQQADNRPLAFSKTLG
jgi:hypothetical protein